MVLLGWGYCIVRHPGVYSIGRMTAPYLGGSTVHTFSGFYVRTSALLQGVSSCQGFTLSRGLLYIQVLFVGGFTTTSSSEVCCSL
jgi:hypothetical protein